MPLEPRGPAPRSSKAPRPDPTPPGLATDVIRHRPASLEREAPALSETLVAQPPASGPQFPFLLPPVEPDEIGRLGTYRVLRLLGTGGMAYVFHAEDIALRREVALKVMKPDLGGHGDAWQRFLREARIMAAVKHDYLVTVYQVGQEGGVVYLAMELLQGETLEDWGVREGPPPVVDVLRLGREIATGLA